MFVWLYSLARFRRLHNHLSYTTRLMSAAALKAARHIHLAQKLFVPYCICRGKHCSGMGTLVALLIFLLRANEHSVLVQYDPKNKRVSCGVVKIRPSFQPKHNPSVKAEKSVSTYQNPVVARTIQSQHDSRICLSVQAKRRECTEETIS